MARGVVEISWSSREQLLERLRSHAMGAPVIAAFKAVGTTASVPLTVGGERALLETIEAWRQETTTDPPPADIFKLRNALRDEDATG